MKERDYLRKRLEIEQKCQQDIAALDRVWAMFNQEPPPLQQQLQRRPVKADYRSEMKPTVSVSPSSSEDTPNKRAAVRDAVHTLHGEFATRDVRAPLDSAHPEVSKMISDQQLSTIVSKLASRGELRVVKAKAGRASATYAPLAAVVEEFRAS